MNLRYYLRIVFYLVILNFAICCQNERPISLFDGQTFKGWQGDTLNTWRIVDETIVGGSLLDTVPHNDFLVTTEPYENYILRLKFKLEDQGGFANAGVQFRSQRLADPVYEMIGYQADIGEGYWGALYDESRRKRVLAAPDSNLMKSVVKIGHWNDYKIRAEGPHIQLFVNGEQTVDYTEADASIPQTGYIGLQIHGGGKVRVSYKDITIEPIDF